MIAPEPYEFKATIIEIVSIRHGTGTVRYEDDDGNTGIVGVIAEGWDDVPPREWPPQVGDEIKIYVQPTVHLWRRAAGEE